MIRKINNYQFDYRRYDHYETDESIVLNIEYGESDDGLRFYVKNNQLTILKEGKIAYPELQALVNTKLREFEDGNLLD
jgi:hypothetical protein